MGVLARRRAQQGRLGVDLLEILGDHRRLRDGVSVDLQRRDAAERTVFVELLRKDEGRLLGGDIGETLGVDLHPHPRRVRTDVPGTELHRHRASPSKKAEASASPFIEYIH